MNYIVLTFLICMHYVTKSHGYYFWKDFQKKVPFTAFSAGEDTNRDKVYIGQAFLFDESYQGIYPTSILIDKDVYVPRYGARKADNFVQILCSTDPENFQWIPTNSTHFHVIDNSNELVRGGIEYHEWVSIGRLKIQGGVSIGKIMSGDIGQADMWFVHNGGEKKAEMFEVLTYNAKKNTVNGRKP